MRLTSVTATLLTLLVWVAQSSAASAAGAVSDTAPEAAAAAMVQALNQRNEAAAVDFLDMAALGERIGKSMTTDPKQQREMAHALNEGTAHRLIQTYFKILDTRHGTVRLMRTTERNGQVLALLRFDMGGSGFDYLEFILQPDGTGRYRAVDWYQLSRGELMSVNLGALVKLMADPDPDLVSRLLGTTRYDTNQVAKLKQMGTLQRSGDYAGALAVANQLPPEIADSRFVLTVRVTLASLADNKAEHQRILGVLAHKYSNDPTVAFMLIDYYFNLHQMDKAMECVTTIERRVGSDGVTNLLKANIDMMTGAYTQGVGLAQQAIRLEPDLQDAYYSLAVNYVGLKQYAQAIAVYKSLATRFKVKFDRKHFEHEPRFAGLVQSADFQKWMPAGAPGS
jgi:tetratricopeptide (TPR) repeat protein